VQNCGHDGRRNGGQPRQNSKEERHHAVRFQIVVIVEHLSFPSPAGTNFPVLESVAFPSRKQFPDLMIDMYVRGPFAKMTGLPDNLTETPHTYAGRGH
jgi:hypothetical protein